MIIGSGFQERWSNCARAYVFSVEQLFEKQITQPTKGLGDWGHRTCNSLAELRAAAILHFVRLGQRIIEVATQTDLVVFDLGVESGHF